MEVDHADILVVATVAVLAPVLADLSRRAKMPIVVVEIFLGIIVGPQVLGLADTDSFIEALSTFGLAFLFFLAGMEIDFERIRGAAARDGVAGWGISLGLGSGARNKNRCSRESRRWSGPRTSATFCTAVRSNRHKAPADRAFRIRKAYGRAARRLGG